MEQLKRHWASCILIEGVAERYILRVKQSGGVFFFSLKYLAEKCINREDKFGNKNALNMIVMAFKILFEIVNFLKFSVPFKQTVNVKSEK